MIMSWVGMVTGRPSRSEEHTSELQSRQYLACRLLLEKIALRHVRVSIGPLGHWTKVVVQQRRRAGNGGERDRRRCGCVGVRPPHVLQHQVEPHEQTRE